MAPARRQQPPAASNGNGATAWWKWSAAILGALIIGLIPYLVAASKFVSQDDLEQAKVTLIDQTSKAREILTTHASQAQADIAKLNAQIVDLSDRIEQLRAQVASLEQQVQGLQTGGP